MEPGARGAPLQLSALRGLHEQLLPRDPDRGAGHHGALRVPRKSRPQIHPPPAVRQAAALPPAAAPGRPGRSPGQKQRHERAGPRAGAAAHFRPRFIPGGGDCRPAAGAAVPGALQARGLRRAGPQPDCSVFCGLRRRRGQPRGRGGDTRPVAALQPERPRAQQQLLRSSRVVLRGSRGGAQAGGQEPAGARSRKRRRHRHGLFELHRFHQEIPAPVFRRRSASQGRP